MCRVHTRFALIDSGFSVLYTITYMALLSQLLSASGQGVYIPEFAQMCGRLMGKPWEYLGSFFSLLAVTGATVVYWVLMTNFLYNTVTYIYGRPTHRGTIFLLVRPELGN